MFKYIITLVILFFSTSAIAQEDWDRQKYDFRWMHVPVVCGDSEEIQRYLKDNDFELESVSMGRESAQPDGTPVYIVSYYINKEKTQTISVVSTPNGTETCMLYKSFDLVYYDGETT